MNHDFNSGHATVAPPSSQRRRNSNNGLIGRLTAGKSLKLPTYIDYNKITNNAEDDKHAKHRHGRLVNRANTAKGWAGALLRSAIRAGLLEAVFWRRVAIVIAALLALCLLLFHWTYETHIELAFHNRNWIKRAIIPVPPLSETCFSPSHIAASSYNTSLADSPKHLLLNPGISMKFGLDCYHFSEQLPSTPLERQDLPEHTTFHLFWRADLAPFQDRQALLIKSLFTTQDMSTSDVVLWTNDVSLLGNQLLVQIQSVVGKDKLAIRVADFVELAKGTPMEGHALLSAAGTRDRRGWVDGDLLRVLALYAYGGVWVDMDTVLLRSVRPLLEQEWVTQWDCYDKPYAPLNGAMLSFYKHSPYLCEMLHAMASSKLPPRSSSTDWGSLLYHQVHRRLLQAGKKPFSVLPYCLTDPRSCRLDNRLPDPFEKDHAWIKSKNGEEELKYKLESIFAIHLHNQWEKTFPKDGWMQKFVVDDIEQKWKDLQEARAGAGAQE